MRVADKKEGKAAKKVSEYKPGKMCQKCGARMAEHKDRYACGRCGYTEYKAKGNKV